MYHIKQTVLLCSLLRVRSRVPARILDFENNSSMMIDSIKKLGLEGECIFMIDRSIRIPVPMISRVLRESVGYSSIFRTDLYAIDSYIPFNYRGKNIMIFKER